VADGHEDGPFPPGLLDQQADHRLPVAPKQASSTPAWGARRALAGARRDGPWRASGPIRPGLRPAARVGVPKGVPPPRRLWGRR
jgi:hypothetical protein